jgi:hypothetical protein
MHVFIYIYIYSRIYEGPVIKYIYTAYNFFTKELTFIGIIPVEPVDERLSSIFRSVAKSKRPQISR